MIKITTLWMLLLFIGGMQAMASSKPEEIASNGGWAAYTFTENKQKVCYLAGAPKTSEGDYKKRGDVFLFITHYPDLNVFDDLYFDMGYPVKTKGDATASIGKKNYTLTGDKTHLFSEDRKQDKQMIQTLKQNDQMVVKSLSQRGTKTVDTFDLSGFSKTYQAMSKACKKRD